MHLAAGLERGEVGAGAGLGIALAVDALAGEDARQVVPLLLLGAERHQHRPAHGEAEGDRARRIGERLLLVPDIFLRHRPAGPAPFGRPVGRDPALVVERPVPRHHLVERRLDAEPDLARHIARQRFGQEGTALVAKGFVFRGEIEVHGAGVPARVKLPRTLWPPAPDCKAAGRRAARPTPPFARSGRREAS